MRWSHVVPLTLAALLAVAPAADAKHKRKPSCSVRGAVVIAKNREAVVLARNVQFSQLEDGREYYGCVRKKRRPVFFESESSNQYGSSDVGHLVLRGTYVAYDDNVGFIDGSCHDTVKLFSIRRRTQVAYASATGDDGTQGNCPSVGKLVANRAGILAWTAG